MGVRPGTPKPPGSGRKRGSLDREARQLLSGKMAKAIFDTYQKLGPDWLLKIAQDKPELFCSVFLQRLLPPALKDPADDSPLVALNFNNDPIEQGRRIAFALARAADAMGQDPVVDREPYSRIAPDNPAGPSVFPVDPASEAAREEWAREAAMSPEERLNSESLDAHTNRRAFAESAPAQTVQQKVRAPVRLRNPKNRDDLL